MAKRKPDKWSEGKKPVRIAAMSPSVPRNPKAEAQHARAVAASKGGKK